jgi:hypothetical protein
MGRGRGSHSCDRAQLLGSVYCKDPPQRYLQMDFGRSPYHEGRTIRALRAQMRSARKCAPLAKWVGRAPGFADLTRPHKLGSVGSRGIAAHNRLC